MNISSIALTNFDASSLDVPTADVDYVETCSVVPIGAVGANNVSNVEGTVVVNARMTCTKVVAISIFFNWINLSNSFFVSLN